MMARTKKAKAISSFRPLSWKPRARMKGRVAIYCAPACGRECTRMEYDRAKRMSKLLAKALGPAWKPDVWENLGWHWAARVPDPNDLRMEVHGNGPRLSNEKSERYSYSVFFGPQHLGTVGTPDEALTLIVTTAESWRDEMERALSQLRRRERE